ncbi:MAG: hypothetical protein WCJ97_11455 [Phycisphaerae bacterium]
MPTEPPEPDLSGLSEADKARAEADQLRKDWEGMKDTLDPADRARMEKVYDDAINDRTKYADGLDQAAANQQAQAAAQAADDAARETETIDNLKKNFEFQKNAQAKYLLEAQAYAAAGRDPSEFYRLAENAGRNADGLREGLESKGLSADYVPPDDLMYNKPDTSIDKMFADHKAEAEAMARLGRMNKAALDHGLYDAIDPIDQAQKDILAGKGLDPDKMKAISTFIEGRSSGRTLSDYDGWKKAQEELALGKSVQETAQATGREFVTGVDADGNMSKKAMLGRGLLGVLTLGHSELVMSPTEQMIGLHDDVMAGKSTGECLKNIGERVAIGEVFTVVGWVGGKGLNHVAPGLTDDIGKGVGEMFHGSGDDAAKGVGHALGGSGDDIAKGATHGVGGVGDDLAHGAGKSHVPDLNPEQAATHANVTKALATEGKAGQAAVNDLYKDGGMKKLADLERSGALTPEQAAHINKQITNTVNESVDEATAKSIQQMKAKGIDIKEVMVGDSGSSAGRSPGNRSVLSDGDRSLLVQPKPEALADYAQKHGITPAEAQHQINQEYRALHNENMEEALKSRGLTSKDVKAESYSGHGNDVGGSAPTAGGTKPPADSHSANFIAARDNAQGKIKVYNGETGKAHLASPDAMTDQIQINKNTHGLPMDPDPTRMTKKDFNDLIHQQKVALDSLAEQGHSGFIDPKSAAKSVNRFNLGQQGLHTNVPAPHPQLSSIAAQIGKNPQSMSQILKANGMTEAQFNALATQYVKSIPT